MKRKNIVLVFVLFLSGFYVGCDSYVDKLKNDINIITGKTEDHFVEAITLAMDVSNVDTGIFAVNGSPSLDSATSNFPNERAEKFLDFDGSNDYYNFDATQFIDLRSGVISVWVKPEFLPSDASSHLIFSSINTTISTRDGIQLMHYSSATATPDEKWNAGIMKDNAWTNEFCFPENQWNIGEVTHIVLMWENNSNLDSGNSISMYLNGQLSSTVSNQWSIDNDDLMNSNSTLGAAIGSVEIIHYWDGGMYDFTFLNYEYLSARYSDQQIVDILYQNSFGASDSHRFCHEIVAP